MNRRLARWTGGYFVAIGIIVAAVLPFALDVLRIETAMRHNLDPAMNDARALLSTALDQETGQRGYLLTGDESFLAPYNIGRDRQARVEQQLSHLSLSHAEKATLQSTLVSLHAWQQQADPLIAQARAGHVAAARSDAVTARSRDLFDAFRANERAFVDTVDRHLASDRNELHTNSILAIVALLAASGIAALSATLIRRRVRALIDREERNLQQRNAFTDVHRLSATLARLQSTEVVATTAAREARDLLGATDVHVWIIGDRERLHLVGSTDTLAQSGSAPSILALNDAKALADAVRRNETLVFDDRDAFVDAYPGWAWALDVQDAKTLVVLPTRSERETVGVLEAFYDTAREIDDPARTVFELTADQIGNALARSQTREREHEAAARLQESLLGPPTLVEGVGHTTRYLPAEATLHIGGDWHNAQRIADDRILIAVGDVVGRGLEAATVMGQLRSAVSACAPRCETPAELLTALDAFGAEIPGAACATVALAFVDVRNEQFHYVCAGHPPPILVTPSGEVSVLEAGRTWPLALGRARPAHLGATVAFPPGSLIVMYSDGLVERRREPIDEGIGRVAEYVRAHWRQPIDTLSDGILAALLGDQRREDDIALLVLRSPVTARDVFLMKLAATPDSVGRVRERLRAWLDNLDLDPEDQLAVLVAVGEACTNAVEHAYGDRASKLFRVEASVDGEQILCCVTDSGAWKDNAARTARGNGLSIMRELMDTVTIDRRAAGTSITLTFRPGVRHESAVLR
jgi:serine phosphatase RsbU (regulator of sigma subunit)/anti-sigma regulatory factor (Ser/Thr protein kinase)/CHASE3 domain sensor protein